MKKIIMAKNLVKSFGEKDEKHIVLEDVSIEIHAGEFVAVMGPSGSGKSTLMCALSGMDDIESGEITFEDKMLATLNEKELADIRRKKMGFVFQQPTLLKNLNVLDNIILPSMHENKKNRIQVIEKAKLLMRKMGISELESRYITEVSGGQLQRAGICRALMGNPKIIFGDEPTGALNSKAAEEIMVIFYKINKEGTAIMLVTHDAKVAAMTERVMFMCDGKIVDEMQLSKFMGIDKDQRIKKITEKMRKIGI